MKSTRPDVDGREGVSPWRLVALARSEWPRLALGSVFLLLGSATSLAYPQALRRILDEAVGRRDPAVLDRAVSWMLALFVMQALAVSLRFILFSVAGERVVARLREEVYRAILRQEIAFFDARKTGELTSRLASDTTVLQNTVSVNVSMVLRNFVTIVGGVAMLLWTSPRLAALMLAVVPPVAIGAVLYGRRVRALSREVQDTLAHASEVAEESIAGVRTVRSFAAEGAEAERYAGAIERSFSVARHRAVTAGVFIGGASFAAFSAAAAVLWYGGRLVLSGAMSVGALSSFLVYSLVVGFSLAAVSDVWADFMKASGAGARIFELIDRKPTMSPGGACPAAARGAVRFDDVSFRYPSRPEAVVLGLAAFPVGANITIVDMTSARNGEASHATSGRASTTTGSARLVIPGATPGHEYRVTVGGDASAQFTFRLPAHDHPLVAKNGMGYFAIKEFEVEQ